jgi:AcrR family transcriptional regulator
MVSRAIESRRRLEQAAEELYREHGYGYITAAQIAEKAGLTERTFFRHFADKREMLFAGGSEMQQLASEAIHVAKPGQAFELALAGLQAVTPLFEDNPDRVRERQRIIDADVTLQERELTKHNQFCEAISVALKDRGVDDPTADLTGSLSGVVFHNAFVSWVQDPGHRLGVRIAESAESVRLITGG